MLPYRKDGLLFEEIAAEFIAYDPGRHRAHCLNSLAKAVLDLCDGTRSVKQLAPLVAAKLNMPVTEEAIGFALAKLEKARLLREDHSARDQERLGAFTRRELGRKLTVAGIAAVVVSIAVPTAAQAATCAHSGQSCDTAQGGKVCCPGCNCTASAGFKTCTGTC